MNYLYRYFKEIKSRILLVFVSWFSIFFVSYTFKEILLYSVIHASSAQILSFIFTDVTEVFSVYLFLIIFFTNQILLFFFCYHIFSFILPSLTNFESSFIVFAFLISVFLSFLSFLVFNNVLLPLSWDFFLSFQNLASGKYFFLDFEAKLSEYCIFYVRFYFICWIYFQLLLVPVLFFKSIKNNLEFYFKTRKVLCYFCVFFSTILTPPDVLSQIILSFCSIFCFEALVYCLIFKSRF